MILLVSGATATVARYPQLGRLVSPRAGNRIDEIAASGRPWAADNDAFSGWDAERYWQMLVKISHADRTRLLFVACPDRVCDARETLNLWWEWHGQLDALGLPAAFVGQNGIEDLAGEIPWDGMACFFVGGDTRWKLSEASESLCFEAKRRGKLVHVGRVNSRKRLRHAAEIGADSADGRQWSKWPDRWIPKGLRWIDDERRQGALFPGKGANP